MKLAFEISKLAITDIESIFEFTTSNWSLNQAKYYHNLIFETISELRVNPNVGKSIEEIKKGYKTKLVGSHIIIYKVEKRRLLISRILHQRMDIDFHLKD